MVELAELPPEASRLMWLLLDVWCKWPLVMPNTMVITRQDPRVALWQGLKLWFSMLELLVLPCAVKTEKGSVTGSVPVYWPLTIICSLGEGLQVSQSRAPTQGPDCWIPAPALPLPPVNGSKLLTAAIALPEKKISSPTLTGKAYEYANGL